MNAKLNSALTTYLSKDKINVRLKEIANQLSKKFFDESPVVIGVLNGSFIFLADLIRLVEFDCEVDFIKVNSYVGKKSLGRVKLDKDVTIDIENKRVILVEDIIDSGLTIDYLYEHILSLNPKDVTIVTLLSKKNNYSFNFNIDIIGFEIASDFVVGYGLDLNHRFRHLDSLYKLKPKN